MKTLTILTLVLFTAFQHQGGSKHKSQNEEKLAQTTTGAPSNYQLFPTANIWNFLKLDTRNGRIWQVQFSMKADNRISVSLNSDRLVDKEDEAPNRFTLVPTENQWTFILLDQVNAKTWQVQWALDAKDRGIITIPR